MIDSIFVALSGMRGHERGLNVISNNITNLNTAGFRGSTVNFRDVFSGGVPGGSVPGQQSRGAGLDASLTLLDLRPGDPMQTDRDQDLRLEGDGFFIVQNEVGEQFYTRAGAFKFDTNGVLMVRGQKLKVMARTATGALVPLDLAGLRTSPPKATSTITLDQTLSGDGTEHTIEPVTVFDKTGGKHTLELEFRKDATTIGVAGSATWTMTVSEDLVELGSGKVEFAGNQPTAASRPLRLLLRLGSNDPTEIAFDFGATNGNAQGQQSSLAVRSQDGFESGQLTVQSFDQQKFDTKGIVQLVYSNGQTVAGPQLALAQIGDESGLQQVGDALFEYRGAQSVTVRTAADDLQVVSGSLERSNVNLTEEFSELILMQRGFQASSQALSTANDMLQELLELRNRR